MNIHRLIVTVTPIVYFMVASILALASSKPVLAQSPAPIKVAVLITPQAMADFQNPEWTGQTTNNPTAADRFV